MEEDNIHVNIDKGHGGKPDHVDVTTPIPDLGGAHKIEINPCGEPYREEIWVGKQKTQV